MITVITYLDQWEKETKDKLNKPEKTPPIQPNKPVKPPPNKLVKPVKLSKMPRRERRENEPDLLIEITSYLNNSTIKQSPLHFSLLFSSASSKDSEKNSAGFFCTLKI